MKKTLADKMAEKAFENPNVQKSWQTHLQAFGPILENVFQEDIKSRIHLINALNHLSRQELKKAYKLMQDLEKVCSTDYDKTAWYFFMALIFCSGKFYPCMTLSFEPLLLFDLQNVYFITIWISLYQSSFLEFFISITS